jgi:hypothetical protein
LPFRSGDRLKFRCLAGLQAGVLGGLAMLLYLSLDAILHRQRWLTPEVLLSTAVYGNSVIWHASAKAVLAGVSVQLVAAGLAGALCGYVFEWIRGDGLTALFTGLGFAFGWYLFWHFLLLPKVAPLVAAYASRESAIAAHLLLGLMLSRIPNFYGQIRPAGRLAEAHEPPAPLPAAATFDQPSDAA